VRPSVLEVQERGVEPGQAVAGGHGPIVAGLAAVRNRDARLDNIEQYV
jgi:hypothetical protein